jgi:hypothetical protein
MISLSTEPVRFQIGDYVPQESMEAIIRFFITGATVLCAIRLNSNILNLSASFLRVLTGTWTISIGIISFIPESPHRVAGAPTGIGGMEVGVL